MKKYASTFKKLHYSTFNFLMLLITYCYDNTKTYHSIFINNTIGLALTWYFAIIYDTTIPRRLMTKNNWNFYQFIMGDLILHLIPLIYSICNLNNLLNRNIGIYTFTMNVLWCGLQCGSLNISSSYVDVSNRTMLLLWFINYITHMLSSIFIITKI